MTFRDPGVGAAGVGGIDLNRPRARAVMRALLALSPGPIGFTSSELAAKVRELTGDERYSPSRAAYDLRKLRCKNLVSRVPRSHRYQVDPTGIRAMAALLLLRDKVFRPLIAATSSSPTTPTPRRSQHLDRRYRVLHQDMRHLFATIGLAA